MVYPSLKSLQFDEEERNKFVILHNVKYIQKLIAL